MNTFGSLNDDSDKRFNPWSVIGGPIGWLDETGFEAAAKPVSETTKGFFNAIKDLGQDILPGKESNSKETLPSNGSIEFNKVQKQKENAEWKKTFYQRLKDEENRAQKDKDKLTEEEINDMVANLPTDQKNQLLHYQASYKDRSIYQRAELRKKLIEQQKKAEDQKKQASIPSPAKQANAMDTAFEGGSGKSGTGSANFSSTGGGAG